MIAAAVAHAWAKSDATLFVRTVCGSHVVETWAVPVIERLHSVTLLGYAVKTKTAGDAHVAELASMGAPLPRSGRAVRAMRIPIGEHRALTVNAVVSDAVARFVLHSASPSDNVVN